MSTDSNSLSFASGWSENDWRSEAVERHFMDRVNEHADEEVEWEYHPDQQLGGFEEMHQLVQGGSVDMAITLPPYLPGSYQLSEVGLIPGLVTDQKSASESFWRLLSPEQDGTLFEEEFEPNGLRPVMASQVYPAELCMGSERIETIDEVEGKLIRTSGSIGEWTVNAMGASPVTMSGSEVYNALDQGTIEGTISPLTVLNSSSQHEVINYMTEDLKIQSFPEVYSMNVDSWNNLSDGTQEAFITAADEVITNRHDAMMDKVESDREAIGDSIEYYSVDDPNAWENQLSSVQDRWIESFDDQELAETVLEKFGSEA
ncbi:TRAP transporter substrate-binding protein [Natrinema soli]|uniref:TRAP transporter substrate-binding protein n=2 Tax=Natrinema soli TaxID=1930624 RepID=A0ABD5SMY1_9EURY